MREHALYLCVLLVSGLTPMLGLPATPSRVAQSFPGFPAAYAHMNELPLAEHERMFLRDFPGKLAKFSDGERHYVVRWVHATTRRLHPAADCFRASGYTLEQTRDGFWAERNGTRVHVHETIRDASGRTYRDVGAWYWAATRGQSKGPWWSVTTISNAGGLGDPVAESRDPRVDLGRAR
jgi:hypothetical protein